MLRISIYVDMKVYVLQLKQKSTVGVLHVILRNFRTATFDDNFERLLLKRKQARRRVRVPLFLETDFYWVMKQSSLSTSFDIAECFNMDYVIRFHKAKKELQSTVFTIKILVAEIFGRS